MNEKDIKNEIRFECTQCGKCCTDKSTIVNVTYLDILRIRKGLNLTVEEVIDILGFFVFNKEITNEDLLKMVVPPIETEKGVAFIGLSKNSRGCCYFYDEEEKKCKIYMVRPMFCQTFPFTFNLLFDKQDKTRAKIKMTETEKGKQYCPGLKGDPPIIDDDKWIRIGKQTIEDLNDNSILTAQWNNAAKKDKVNPTVRNFILNIFNLEKRKLK